MSHSDLQLDFQELKKVKLEEQILEEKNKQQKEIKGNYWNNWKLSDHRRRWRKYSNW
jgi:hypothetical protein